MLHKPLHSEAYPTELSHSVASVMSQLVSMVIQKRQRRKVGRGDHHTRDMTVALVSVKMLLEKPPLAQGLAAIIKTTVQ